MTVERDHRAERRPSRRTTAAGVFSDSRRVVDWWAGGAVVLLLVGQPATWWWGPPPPTAVAVGLLIWLGAAAIIVRQGIRRRYLSPVNRCLLLFLLLPALQELTLRTGGTTAPTLVFYPAIAVGGALLRSRRFFQLVVAATVSALVLVGVTAAEWTPHVWWSLVSLAALTILLPTAVWWYIHSLRRRTEQAALVLEQWEQRDRFFDPTENATDSSFQAAQQEQAVWLQTRYRERAQQLLSLLKQAIPHARSCVLFLYQPALDRLQLELCIGGPAHVYRDELEIVVGHGVIGWAAKEGKPCLYARLDPRRQQPEYYRTDAGVRSLLVLPFSTEGRLEGVLCVDSEKTGALGDREEGLAALTAGCLRAQLEDLRQQRQVVQKSREFSRLLEASQLLNSGLDLQHRLETMTGLTQSIVPSTASILCLVDGGERHASIRVVRGGGLEKYLDHRFSLTDGVVSLIVKNRQPILLSHLSEDQPTRFFPLKSKIRMTAGSFLGLPMILKDRVIGLFICTADIPSAFTAIHQNLLSILCNQAAQAIADAQSHAEVERLASIDGLTGIFNHRAFHDRLHYEWEQAQRHGEALTLMMIDLDHFKRINDTYGHQAGDRILKQVVACLLRLVRKVDTLGRYGGEEFAVLLPKTTAHQAWKMAERIRKVIECGQFGLEGVTIPVTLSIGVASAPSDAGGPDQLVSVADKALYWAKEQGRNRIALYPDVVSAMARVD